MNINNQGLLDLSIITTAAAAAASIEEHWEVQYARHFNFPSRSSSAGLHPSLTHPVKKFKGTWLSSVTALADLKLLTATTDHSHTLPSIILTVNLLGNVIEEHYISNLHFTWPQITCMSGYPPRGSKSVFISYRDQVGQIQKFAVRFHSVEETESFVNCIKEVFGYEKSDSSMSAISKSKTPYQSEILRGSLEDLDQITSTADYSQDVYRPLIPEWSPQTSPADTYNQPVDPSENHDSGENSTSQETTLTQDFQKLSAFPPSFTSLLTGCYPVNEQATQKTVTDEVNLKKEILKYLEDSSFQDILSKVQEVMSEFEDDLLM